MLQLIQSLGDNTRDLILAAAGLLTEDYVPGIVAAFLLLCLLVLIAALAIKVQSRLKALRWFSNIINSHRTPHSFTSAVVDINQKIDNKNSNGAYQTLADAWHEYRETLVLYGEGDARLYRNSVRPSTFFNVEDLKYGPGFWRIVPGLFVTIGLFLTFLGLVAALNVMEVGSADSATLQLSLDKLLKAASAKFIMSLTGLFCSIIFTVALRLGIGQIESNVHRLCSRLESQLTFISLEDISVEQLSAIKEQREHFRAIGTELVAELGRPLREELPQSISKSISEAMAPMVERVTQVGTEGVGTMVQDLSSRFTEDVGAALANASDSIELAGRKIGDLAARMDQSSGTMNEQLMNSIKGLNDAILETQKRTEENAVKTGDVFKQGADQLLAVMSDTLGEIRDNTGKGAEAIKDAAAQMRSAADTFRDELTKASEAGAKQVEGEMNKSAAAASGAINTAGADIINTFGVTAQQIATTSEQMTEKLSSELLSPLNQVVDRLASLSAELSKGTSEFKRLNDGINSGASASVTAANSFKKATDDLVSSATPIRSSVERIDAALVKLDSNTNRTAENLRAAAVTITQSAQTTLNSASEILGSKRQAIESALAGMKEITEKMRGQGDRIDDLDVKLGEAFERYNQHVKAVLDSMIDHAADVQKELTPALETMREIVEQAEKFVPESNRR